jgi:hypothetical protein
MPRRVLLAIPALMFCGLLALALLSGPATARSGEDEPSPSSDNPVVQVVEVISQAVGTDVRQDVAETRSGTLR